jgi:hypothetical protein
MQNVTFVCGLGGGLDVVNASILYFVSKSEGRNTMIGSVRPLSQEAIDKPVSKFHPFGTVINGESIIRDPRRYIEPRIAQVLDEDLIFISRNDIVNTKYMKDQEERKKKLSSNSKLLTEAILEAKKQFNVQNLVFVDGGGDSLIFTTGDIHGTGNFSPFEGGDAELLRAVRDIPNVYQAIISVGLDVRRDKFQHNIGLLKEKGKYFGRVNIATGEKQDYTLDHVFNFSHLEQALNEYYKLAEQVLVLKEEHLNVGKDRMPSLTATVSYHAIKGNFGKQRAFVPWEEVHDDGSKGPIVDEEHRWMYFVDAGAVENLKLEVNGLKSSL